MDTQSPEFLLAHEDFLRQLASRLVFDDSAAQDVVQETLISGLEHPPRTDRPVRAWLAKVARNHALQLRRSERRRVAREERSARAEGVPSTAEIVERETARRAVVEAVLALGEPYRSTILLRFYEDLPPRDVARRLNVPVETVRTRTKRGLALLRGKLDSSYGEDRAKWTAALLPLALKWRDPTPSSLARWATLGLATLLFLGAASWYAASRGGARAPQLPEREIARAFAAQELESYASERSEVDGAPAESLGSARDLARASAASGTTVDERGAALAGVTVLAFAGNRPERASGEWPEPVARVESDAAGRFEVAGLPNEFFLHAERGELVAVAGYSAEFAAPGVAEGVQLQLARSFTVSGRVVDEAGRVLAGARVSAVTLARRGPGRAAREADASYRALAAHSTLSASDGRFTLADLPPVKHFVSADLDGLAGDSLGVSPGSSELTLVLSTLDVDASAETSPRVETAAPQTLASLRGSVRDAASGAAVPRFTLSFGARGALAASSCDDADGRFDAGEVDWNNAIVAVRAPGFAPWSVHLRGRPPGAELRVDLEPERELAVRVVDLRGEPAAHARIVCTNERGRPIPARVSELYWNGTVLVAPDGRARLAGMPAGRVVLEVRVPEIARLAPFEVDLRAPREGELVLTLPCDLSSPRREIVIELAGSVREALDLEVFDARGDIAASARLEVVDGRFELARPLRYLVQRYDASGALVSHSLRTLPIDSSVADHGAQLGASNDAGCGVSLHVPLDAVRVRVRGAELGEVESPLAPRQTRVQLDIARR